jgi:hypothetical protein
MGDEDELMTEAKEIIIAAGKASTSLLQRRLRIGYSRAASILDMLEEAGIIGPSNGSKPREILISREQYENSLSNQTASMPVHDRQESQVPDNYLYPEEESPLVFDDSINPEDNDEKMVEEDDEEDDEEEQAETYSDDEQEETDSKKNDKQKNKKSNEFIEDDFSKYFSK